MDTTLPPSLTPAAVCCNVVETKPYCCILFVVLLPLRFCLPWRQRVSANFSFFATNYLMICATCSAVYILRSPGLLLTLLVSMCMFLYVFMSRRKTFVILDVTLDTRAKTTVAGAGACMYVCEFLCVSRVCERVSV